MKRRDFVKNSAFVAASPSVLSALATPQPTNDLRTKIQRAAKDIESHVIEMRRSLHEFPEPSYCEIQTKNFIVRELQSLGIPFDESKQTNSLIATIEGAQAGRTIGLRADFDGLADFEEKAPVAFKSRNHNIMHACGHDCHSSILLGVAKILKSMQSEIVGTVKLIFEAAEEKLPGGSSVMISEGLFQRQGISNIFGLHIDPRLKASQLGFKSGNFMFAIDEIYVTVFGKQGHGATVKPNATHAAARIMAELTNYVNNELKGENDSIAPVLSFGSIYTVGSEPEDEVRDFYGVVNKMELLPIRQNECKNPIKRIVGGSSNVVMSRVKMAGTLRTLNEEKRITWRKELLEKARAIIKEMNFEDNLKCEFHIYDGHPLVHNDPTLTARCVDYAKEYVGEKGVEMLNTWKASESFSEYQQLVPGVFYRLGIQPLDSDVVTPLHTDRLFVDESSLVTGVGFMTYLALNELKK
jgi:metal-dependent amidase/aminoacylase/carboxypeptidase family protein